MTPETRCFPLAYLQNQRGTSTKTRPAIIPSPFKLPHCYVVSGVEYSSSGSAPHAVRKRTPFGPPPGKQQQHGEKGHDIGLSKGPSLWVITFTPSVCRYLRSVSSWGLAGVQFETLFCCYPNSCLPLQTPSPGEVNLLQTYSPCCPKSCVFKR